MMNQTYHELFDELGIYNKQFKFYDFQWYYFIWFENYSQIHINRCEWFSQSFLNWLSWNCTSTIFFFIF